MRRDDRRETSTFACVRERERKSEGEGERLREREQGREEQAPQASSPILELRLGLGKGRGGGGAMVLDLVVGWVLSALKVTEAKLSLRYSLHCRAISRPKKSFLRF